MTTEETALVKVEFCSCVLVCCHKLHVKLPVAFIPSLLVKQMLLHL